MLRPGKLRTQPFVLTRLLPCSGTYRIIVTINLVDAIEAKHRTLERTFSVAALATPHDHSSSSNGALQGRKRRKMTSNQTEEITVTTQEVNFEL